MSSASSRIEGFLYGVFLLMLCIGIICGGIYIYRAIVEYSYSRTEIAEAFAQRDRALQAIINTLAKIPGAPPLDEPTPTPSPASP